LPLAQTGSGRRRDAALNSGSTLSRVKKQQAVYAPLMEYIADNRIHALSIKAFTPQEWARDRKLNGF
jgi:hypothetical protein